jgi:hypothetical protein
MGDILQYSVDVKDISICHTGFWAAAREYGWGDEAKKFLHPDPDDVENEGWQAHKFTRGHLESKLLMIPCNFPGESEVEEGHWTLAIREKGEKGKHKLHVLDSLGQDSGRQHRNIIARKLIRSPIFPNFPKGKSFDVLRQTECECGARVAIYMDDITKNYNNMSGTTNIPNILGMTINWEKKQGRHEVTNCRNRIKSKLEGEIENLQSK